MEKPPKHLLYYLAHPYSSPIPGGEQMNANDATNIAAKLFMDGYRVYSPLTHCHPIDTIVHFTWARWMLFDVMMMNRCDAIILCEGWENSRGCTIEREHFLTNKKPIYHVRDLKEDGLNDD